MTTTKEYAIGSHVESDTAHGEWKVTEHKHWTHDDEGEMVTIMGRRFIKSRNESFRFSFGVAVVIIMPKFV